MDIAKNIQEFRKRMNLSQEDLAEYLGVKREMISYYENGSRPIAMDKLIKLSDLYGVEISDLIEEDEGEHKANLALAFRLSNSDTVNIEVISNFKKIIKNYLKLKRISKEHDC